MSSPVIDDALPGILLAAAQRARFYPELPAGRHYDHYDNIVSELAAGDRSIDDIADNYGLNPDQVNHYVETIYKKLAEPGNQARERAHRFAEMEIDDTLQAAIKALVHERYITHRALLILTKDAPWLDEVRLPDNVKYALALAGGGMNQSDIAICLEMPLKDVKAVVDNPLVRLGARDTVTDREIPPAKPGSVGSVHNKKRALEPAR